MLILQFAWQLGTLFTSISSSPTDGELGGVICISTSDPESFLLRFFLLRNVAGGLKTYKKSYKYLFQTIFNFQMQFYNNVLSIINYLLFITLNSKKISQGIGKFMFAHDYSEHRSVPTFVSFHMKQDMNNTTFKLITVELISTIC